MSLSIITWLSVSAILAFSCTALQIPAPARGLAVSLPANISTASDDVSWNFDIQCNSRRGTGLTEGSCNNIVEYIPRISTMETWGTKSEHPPGSAIDIDVPFNIWADDHLCTLFVGLIGGPQTIATASQLNVHNAARAIVQKCVIGRHGIGGSTHHVGGSERLLVSIDKYPVQVTCQGILESDKESCGQIILDMPKTYTPFGFGSVGDETAEYILPYRMVSPNGTCELVIDTMGPSPTTTNATWYDIWQASEALHAMCLSRQMTGTANVTAGASVQPGLLVTFGDIQPKQSPSLAPNISNATTVLPVNSSTLGGPDDAVVSELSVTSSLASKIPTGVGEVPMVSPFSAPTVASS